MRKLIALAAAVAIHVVLIFAFERSAEEALPKGEVIITELGAESVPALAQAQRDTHSRAVL